MRKFLKITALVLLLLAMAGGGFAYWQALKDNVNPKLKDGFALYIPKGSTFEDVIRSLEEQQVLQSVASFKMISGIRKYDKLVKPGRYEIKRGLNNWKLVEKLRAGAQDQMKLRIGSHRTIMEVAGEIAQQVDLDSVSLLGKMRDKTFLEEYGVEPKTIRNLLIPNTYFVYWTLSEGDLFTKLRQQLRSVLDARPQSQGRGAGTEHPRSDDLGFDRAIGNLYESGAAYGRGLVFKPASQQHSAASRPDLDLCRR